MKTFLIKYEKLIAISITSVLFGFFVGVIVGKRTIDIDFIVTSLATLFAAYIGVAFAFRLQIKKLEEDKREKYVLAGNRAIIELIRTYNKFVMIRNQFINPFREENLRQYLIPPISGTNMHTTQFNIDALTFLVSLKEPELINKLSLFEQEANSTIETINLRSDFHYNIIQPAVELIEKESGPQITKEKIEKKIGKRNQAVITKYTDIVIECVDEIIESAKKHIDSLNGILKEEFKTHTILKMEIPNKSK